MTTLKRTKLTASALILIALAIPVLAQRATSGAPSLSISHLQRIDTVVNEEIAQRHLPGAVVLVSHNGRVAWRKAYGLRATEPAHEPMTIDTIFDVASLTKVVATATSIMMLVERGQVRLSDPVSKYIPTLKGPERERITIEYLLTHRSGYAPDFNLKYRWTGYDEAINKLVAEPLRHPPGARFIYSDIGFIALGEVVRRVSGMPLNEFARKNIFLPLGMRNTGFRPDTTLRARIAPTEKKRAQRTYLGDSPQDADADGDQWL